jgi:phosphatidylglycerol lysyltransferase
MRHIPDAPNGTMDLLFSEVMLWGRERDFRWFDFGVAPLAGLESGQDPALWRRVGTLLYRHGEHFYNFRGLRSYKDKFGPVWTPRYLASPGGPALPIALLDVTALIAGGLRAIVSKRAR